MLETAPPRSAGLARRLARALARATVAAAILPLVWTAPLWIGGLLHDRTMVLWIPAVLVSVPLAFARGPAADPLAGIGPAAAGEPRDRVRAGRPRRRGSVALVLIACRAIGLPAPAAVILSGFALVGGDAAGLSWWDNRPGGGPPPRMFG